MTFHSEEKLMRIAEVTDWLNVSKSTIYKWVKEGTFPKPIILGEESGSKNNTSRWVETEVVAWLASRPRGKNDE
jgi:prophage regulatory protein